CAAEPLEIGQRKVGSARVTDHFAQVVAMEQIQAGLDELEVGLIVVAAQQIPVVAAKRSGHGAAARVADVRAARRATAGSRGVRVAQRASRALLARVPTRGVTLHAAGVAALHVLAWVAGLGVASAERRVTLRGARAGAERRPARQLFVADAEHAIVTFEVT